MVSENISRIFPGVAPCHLYSLTMSLRHPDLALQDIPLWSSAAILGTAALHLFRWSQGFLCKHFVTFSQNDVQSLYVQVLRP
jgi:homogentisate 1,2-dioxygenase